MALKIVLPALLLLLLLVCCASVTQGQGDDTSLPLSYNTTELQGDGATCPSDQLRQELRGNISTEVEYLLQTSILLGLGFPAILPQCSCMSQGHRVAFLDMTDPSQQCPPQWREVSSTKRVCARPLGVAGCRSAFFPVTNISYTRVCGRIVAYQCQDPDGFNAGLFIDSHYIEGVSITHGSPRQHIWSYVATETESSATEECACESGGVDNVIAGRDYFCGSASIGSPPLCNNGFGFIASNPLWDGAGCSSTSTCCELNNPPWFCKTLPVSQPVTDDIEVRICSSGSAFDEDTPIERIEIYVS